MVEGSSDQPKKEGKEPILKKGEKMDADEFLKRVSEREVEDLEYESVRPPLYLPISRNLSGRKHSTSGFGTWQKSNMQERGTHKDE